MKIKLRCIGATPTSLKSGMFTADVIYPAEINFKNDVSGTLTIITNTDKKNIVAFHFTNNKKVFAAGYLFRFVVNAKIV